MIFSKRPPAQAITLHADGIVNVIKTPIVIINPQTKKEFRSQGIWDTGATGSAITVSMVKQLGLIPAGKSKVKGVHGGEKIKDVYYVIVGLPNRVAFALMAVECDKLSEDDSEGMLLGMDIITLGDFAITNSNGKTIMSFRVPSQGKIDFVETERIKGGKVATISPIVVERKPITLKQKVGRNDPCPCGSGKKYKYCHGKP
ncbi:MAG: hypothetical protein A2Y71_03065 [Bacteroidetes bacterium RBG_13_42_15]|nr:MAG: hypothetical protein A2Y71_03065 [Bacteroidetes bacterium RBG_13_42_15]